MDQQQSTKGQITRVIFDVSSMPENYSPGFNLKSMGLDIDEMRKNPTVMDITEDQISMTHFDVPEGGARAVGFEDNMTLNARYVRNKDNPIISFSLNSADTDGQLKVHIKDIPLKKVAEAKYRGVHPAAFVGSHFEGNSIIGNDMFYLKLAHEIDKNFTVFLQSEIARLIATQIDPPAPQAPKVDEPVFH